MGIKNSGRVPSGPKHSRTEALRSEGDPKGSQSPGRIIINQCQIVTALHQTLQIPPEFESLQNNPALRNEYLRNKILMDQEIAKLAPSWEECVASFFEKGNELKALKERTKFVSTILMPSKDKYGNISTFQPLLIGSEVSLPFLSDPENNPNNRVGIHHNKMQSDLHRVGLRFPTEDEYKKFIQVYRSLYEPQYLTAGLPDMPARDGTRKWVLIHISDEELREDQDVKLISPDYTNLTHPFSTCEQDYLLSNPYAVLRIVLPGKPIPAK